MKPQRGAIADRDSRAAQRTSAWRLAHGCSGLTSRLVLAHVEREANANTVQEMLAALGMGELEDRLRDENSWFSFDTKLALFNAAERTLGDPHVAEHIGASALELSVGLALKRTLRALGTPTLVYSNVARANSKFNWAHELAVVDEGPGWMRMRYADVSGAGYHRHDCEYTKGLLATVPQLFGLPLARVKQTTPGLDGDTCVEFDIRWTTGTHGLKRAAIGLAAGAGVAATASALLDPALLTVVAGVLAVGELGIAARAMRFMGRRLCLLELRVREQDDAAERLLSSLEDLSSDLRLDDVLDQITAKAQTAVGGKEFVLLLADGIKMRADRRSGIPAASLPALELWAAQHQKLLLEQGAVVIDDLRTEEALVNVPLHEGMPFGSMCAAPLVFGDGLLGVLVALAHGSTVFLPGDADALSAYAAHAAIALTNAQLVDRLEHQAAEDPLTGLANRRAFYEACAVESSRTQRSSSELSIMVLDLDYFKAINDEHGHLYGDQVLVGVADALRSSIRRHDTVARMGGEEFAILMPEADADAAYQMAERVRAAIACVDIQGGSLSCSAGVVSASVAHALPSDLLDLADKALYEAKRAGRDRTATNPGTRHPATKVA